MTNRCPHCGVKLEAGNTKCGFCGAPLDVQGGTPPQFPPIPTLYPSALWYSWILSPAFGCWCCWRNAKALGDKRMEQLSSNAFFAFLGLTVLLLALCAVAVGLGVILNIGWIVMWLVYCFFINKPQVDFIKKYDITWRKKSLLVPRLIALGLCVASVAALVGIMILANG